MKIYTLAPQENWICDRFANEWKNYAKQYDAISPGTCDIIWLLADWCWNQIDINLLATKKVVATVHHIVPEKFDIQKRRIFTYRDQFIDVYHVPCKKTYNQLKQLTNKPINVFPFWVNQNIWYDRRATAAKLRQQYNIADNTFLIGSFQRDTEGHDLISPKLEKGPDLLCQVIQSYSKKHTNVEVILAGWRRQYVMSELAKLGIKYHYFELPSFEHLNNLYNILNLYVVSSRYEGGPQAVVECATNRTPIISTDVGLASEILHDNSIFTIGNELLANPNIEHAHNNVVSLFMNNGFKQFEQLFNEVYKL
tara:strand:+ start:5568 stop:6494 length:927 start_codon:yes stop_codon:yes gene_type:complete